MSIEAPNLLRLQPTTILGSLQSFIFPRDQMKAPTSSHCGRFFFFSSFFLKVYIRQMFICISDMLFLTHSRSRVLYVSLYGRLLAYCIMYIIDCALKGYQSINCQV
ncbi:hypothetical protein V8C42DRAFT_217100 [Trichoderma barbatum]